MAVAGSAFLGDAFKTLHVQRSPRGRRQLMSRSQVPFAALVTLVLIGTALAGVAENHVAAVGIGLGLVLAVTAGSLLLPWERSAEINGLIISSLDLIAVAIIAGAITPEYPTVGLLQLLPVVIVAYSFGMAGSIVAISGSFLVALAPIMAGNPAPQTASAWISLILIPVSIAALSASLYRLYLILQRSENRLNRARAESDRSARLAKEEQAVMRTVLDTMDVGTAFVHLDNSIAFTNPVFSTIVALSRVDQETRAGTAVFESDRQTPVSAEHQMMAQAARGDYFDSRLYWLGEPGTSQRGFLVTARPVLGTDDQRIGSVFVSKDVTDLTDAMRAREDFLAGVSHELRTPLTSIIGYLEVIDDSIDADTVGISRELGIIQRNANQLMMRIGDLLHVTDQELALRRLDVDVPKLVLQAIDAISFRAKSSGVTINASLPEAFFASVDPGRFAQVIDNLLTNAVKYTPKNGHVDVSLEVNETSMTVVVSDSGVGIPPAELTRVFERFYRAQAVRGGAISGVGLGLAIVKSIVTAHEGSVVVESVVGEGTTFTVILPRV